MDTYGAILGRGDERAFVSVGYRYPSKRIDFPGFVKTKSGSFESVVLQTYCAHVREHASLLSICEKGRVSANENRGNKKIKGPQRQNEGNNRSRKLGSIKTGMCLLGYQQLIRRTRS